MLATVYPQFKEDILRSICEDMVESGVHYIFEDSFQKYFERNQYMAIQLLQRLLRDYYNNVRITKAVLHIVSHYSYEQIGEDFVFPILSLLNHENKAIRKFALKTFDNWDSISTLSVLKGTMPMKEKWLEEYRKNIIYRLERKNFNGLLLTCY